MLTAGCVNEFKGLEMGQGPQMAVQPVTAPALARVAGAGQRVTGLGGLALGGTAYLARSAPPQPRPTAQEA